MARTVPGSTSTGGSPCALVNADVCGKKPSSATPVRVSEETIATATAGAALRDCAMERRRRTLARVESAIGSPPRVSVCEATSGVRHCAFRWHRRVMTFD